MRYVFLLSLITLMAACGARRSSAPVAVAAPASVPFSSGPIYSACLNSDRKKASSRLCGCIQHVANQRLSSSDQAKAARFHAEPGLAQEERQNGSRRFWTTYRAYADQAARTCARA